jgi:hypothetical protein
MSEHNVAMLGIPAPTAPGSDAAFGQHDQIQAFSAAELLEEVRDHYQVNNPESSRGDRF